MSESDSDRRILLVEDESGHAELICRAFADSVEEYSVIVARNLSEAKTEIKSRPPNLALIDNGLPDGQGVALVPMCKDRFPVVILTSHGGEELAVQALKSGAMDYVVKSPEAFDSMPHTVERTLREWHLIQERRQAEEEREKLICELQEALANVKNSAVLFQSVHPVKKFEMTKDIGINWKNIFWNTPMQHSVMVSARIVQRICIQMFLTRKTAIIRKNYQYKWNIFASFRSSVAFSFTKRRTAQNAVHNIKGDRLNSLETLPIADDCHLQAAVMHKRILYQIK